MFYKILYFPYIWFVTAAVWSIGSLLIYIASIGSNQKELAYNRGSRFATLVIIRLIGIRIKTVGTENIPGEPVIFVSNHQSYFDIMLSLVAVPKNFSFISKESVFKVPVIGRFMKVAGHFSLKREAGKKAIDTMVDTSRKLDMGKSLIVFPEGTRSKDGKLGEFKRGASLLVSVAGKNVVPMAIIGTGNYFPKGSLFCNPAQRDITLRFGKPILFEKKLRPTRDETFNIISTMHNAVSELLDKGK